MGEEGRGFTKWQVALAVGAGATAVVGASVLAYVLYRRRIESGSATKPSGTPGGVQNDVSVEVNGAGAGGSEKKSTEGTEQKPKVCLHKIHFCTLT